MWVILLSIYIFKDLELFSVVFWEHGDESKASFYASDHVVVMSAEEHALAGADGGCNAAAGFVIYNS
jgi:hypothetical protein